MAKNHLVTEILQGLAADLAPEQAFLFNAQSRPANSGQPLLQGIDILNYGGEVNVSVLGRTARMGAASSDGRYAPGGSRTPVQSQVMTDTEAKTVDYKWAEVVDFVDIKRSQLPMGEEIAALETVTQVMYVEREARLAAAIFNTGSFTNATIAATFTNKWNTVAGTPLTDMKAISATFRTQTKGIRADTVVTSQEVVDAIAVNPEVRGMYFATAAGVSGGNNAPIPDEGVRQLIASTCGVPVNRVYIGEAYRNTANPGQTEASSVIWTDSFGLYCLNTPMNARRSTGSIRTQAVALADFYDSDEDVGSYDEKDLHRVVYADESRVYQLLVGNYGLFYTDAL